MSKLRVKRTHVLATVGALFAVAALGVGIAANVRVSRSETTTTLGASAFSVGLLDDSTGKRPTDVDKSGLSTDKYYNAKDLEIELAKNATIRYQVNFYDKDKEFLGVQTFTADYTAPSMASTATFVKIEIIPTEDDDDVVSWTEKSGYVGQLTVTVVK